MKFCKNCSAALEDDAVFCTECGTSLADDNFSAGSYSSNQSSYEGAQGTIPDYKDSYSPQGSFDGGNTYSQQQYSAPQGSNPGVPWMIVSIVMLCCCVNIFAVPGLVLSVLSMSSFNGGDIEGSKQKAKTAMILTLCGIVVGLVIGILFWSFIIRLGSTSSYTYTY